MSNKVSGSAFPNRTSSPAWARRCGYKCAKDCNCNPRCTGHCACKKDCKGRCAKGRNLICIDGSSNQFGPSNTNVVELCNRVVRDADHNPGQLRCYFSGVGTSLPPSPWYLEYWKTKIGNSIDLAFAWRLASIVQKACSSPFNLDFHRKHSLTWNQTDG